MSAIPVMLRIVSRQSYDQQEPDVIDLTTEGTLEQAANGTWLISYEESDLTGLEGVTTSFRLSKHGATLRRTGALESRMMFQVGVRHESLYQMEFGAMMITVIAQRIRCNLAETGGTVEISYQLEIENALLGKVDYHLTVTPK